MDFEIKILRDDMGVAMTAVSADSKNELAEAISEACNDAISEQSDWLDGAFEE